MIDSEYDRTFYENQQTGSARSARVIIPIVRDLLGPGTVVDIGCGVGTWLQVFGEYGATEVFGVDGDYVSKAMLRIPPDRFVAHDLTKPLHLGRTFDLAVSLEVAEHIRAEHAQTFVDSLVRHAPVVLFSAAIPYQGGTGHVNEQWPEYWAARFHERGYLPIDAIRRKVWRHRDVDWWYAQNILLFTTPAHHAQCTALREHSLVHDPSLLSLVHPERYLAEVEASRRTVRRELSRFYGTLTSAVGRRLRDAILSSLRSDPS